MNAWRHDGLSMQVDMINWKPNLFVRAKKDLSHDGKNGIIFHGAIHAYKQAKDWDEVEKVAQSLIDEMRTSGNINLPWYKRILA